MHLRKSNEEDLAVISSWFSSAEEAIMWGGHTISYPIEVEQLKKQIFWSSAASFTLTKNKTILGFLQTLDKFGYRHLCRVAIHPEKRGTQLGTLMMELLFDQHKKDRKGFSLFVYESNAVAIKLYKKLGFEIRPHPLSVQPAKGSLFMVRQLE